MPADEVTVTRLVPSDLGRTFSHFTEGIDRWWVRAPGTVVRFEGDRLLEASELGATPLADVVEWNPPHAITLAWRGPHALPGDVVLIEFTPEGSGTRVTVRHQRAGLHPAHASAAVLGLWWADVLRRWRSPDV